MLICYWKQNPGPPLDPKIQQGICQVTKSTLENGGIYLQLTGNTKTAMVAVTAEKIGESLKCKDNGDWCDIF